METPSTQPLRIAILGCGQIADAHLSELKKIENATVVATCDRHLDLAKQAALRFNVPRHYDDLSVMLNAERPDIVHISTPAQSHATLAKQVMSAGAHVYIEKPLALDTEELRDVLTTAQENKRVVCAGHDQLFDPAWLDLRRRVEDGEIGDVRHVDSILGYAISGQFGKVVGANPNHWVRKLPGGLFQNTISHPLYRITEFLVDDHPFILANAWTKPGFSFPTEMFMHMRGQDVTGTLTFSTKIAAQRITRVFGTKGTLEVDLDAQSVIRIAPPSLPGALGKLIAPWRRKREESKAFWQNVRRFARSEIHYFAGMRTLFERFHEAVRNPEANWPIDEQEMLRVTQIMDRAFEACNRDELTPYAMPTSMAECNQREEHLKEDDVA